MAKECKRMRAQREKVDAGKLYDLESACKLVAETKSAKFDETVELCLILGVDPRKAEQNVRGSVALPHGLGKNIRVAVFAKGEKANEATAAGADIVGAEDLAEKVKKLGCFIGSMEYAQLDAREQSDLRDQYNSMENYLWYLSSRLRRAAAKG